ncbi:hypothetical protein TNCT_735951 [Trichonephila clavata]|uniref:Uncharacterized protein n=1 Tax=Trichonephila clavata TaxID=2740835 RepID=A0A8X6GKQ6_TRICU|nr:hypothetical protein TNCT_735951 [Trichonephila clavata]
MRLWPATSRSARNSLVNVRWAEARLFGRDAFYKLGAEHGILKHTQLYSISEFSILQDILTLVSMGTEEKSLRTIASSQSLTGGQGYTQ